MTTAREFKLKEWKYDDMMNKVTRYGDKWMDVDYWTREDKLGTVVVDENGFVEYKGYVEIVKETEKAYRISFECGAWTEWIPKNSIVFVA